MLMPIEWTDIILGTVSGILGLLVAWLGLRGKKEEAAATSIKTLIEGQNNRIKALEDRLAKVENDLEAEREERRKSDVRGDRLADALQVCVDYIYNVRQWVKGGCKNDPPSPPATTWLKQLISQ